MSVLTEINRIKNAVTAIVNALKGKGVTVPSGTKIDGLASLVSSIPQLDTSDATATAENILSGKTAYAKGSKVTGTMPNATVFGGADVFAENLTTSASSDKLTLTESSSKPSNNYIAVTAGGDITLAPYKQTTKAGYIAEGVVAGSEYDVSLTEKTKYYTFPSGVTNTSNATAAASEILSGETAYVNGSKVTGTMPNNGGVSPVSLIAGESYTIPEGYHDGTGVVRALSLSSQTNGNATAEHILLNKVAYVKGSRIIGAMPNNGAVIAQIIPVWDSKTSYTIPEGYHDGTGSVSINTQTKTVTPTKDGLTVTPGIMNVLTKVTVNGDANLVAGNIKSGVSIFGVTGTYEGSSGSSGIGEDPNGMPTRTVHLCDIDGMTHQITYMGYEDGELVEKTAELLWGETLSIDVVMGTKMQFNTSSTLIDVVMECTDDESGEWIGYDLSVCHYYDEEDGLDYTFVPYADRYKNSEMWLYFYT